MQIGIAKALIAARKKGLPVISVSADLQGSTGVADFQKEFPECSVDVGVAESNMVSTAIGLSLTGYIPIVDTFAQFGVTKGALPLTMASLSQGPVIGIFSHTGFQDAADGASHQALSFIAQVSSIPQVETFMLSSSSEAEALLGQTLESFQAARLEGKVPPSRIFFLGRENFPRSFLPAGAEYKLGKAQTVADTSAEHKNSVCIVASGSMVIEAYEAVQLLAEKDIGAVLINASCINRPDLSTVRAGLQKCGGRLVTIEEHRMVGGMGEILTHQLKLADENFKLKSLAIGNGFGQSAYSAKDLYKKHHLDAPSIVNAAQLLLK